MSSEEKLNEKELTNLKTFSDPRSVEEIYNKVGFSDFEQVLIDKYFKKGAHILDVGCGTGRTTVPFFQQGYRVIGIDYSKEMIDFAKKKYKDIDFRVMNACSLDFDDETFDYLYFSFNGIDNIYPKAKRLDCLKEMHRVLKKEGILIYSTHNALALPRDRITLSLFVRNLFTLRIFTHFRLTYEATGILHQYYGLPWEERRDLEQTGFKVLDIPDKYNNGRNFILRALRDMSFMYIAQKN